MNMRLNTKRILIFLAFAFGISWAGTLAFYLAGKTDAMSLTLMNYIVVVPAPTLAHVATRLITGEGWRHLWLRPNLRRGWRFYLAVWLLQFLVMIPGTLAYYLLFPRSFDPNVAIGRTVVASIGLTSVAEAAPVMVMLFLVPYMMIVQGVLTGVVIASLEEFGWRAYLLQKLMVRFQGTKDASIRAGGMDGAAARKAALLVGVIHGVWHWPGMFLGFGFDNTYPGAPFLFPLVYLVFACALSVLLSWGTLRSRSVWPAAIGHGTVLGTMTLAVSMLKGAPNMLLGPQATGLIGGLGFVALALVLLFSRRAFAGEQERRSASAPAAAITSPG